MNRTGTHSLFGYTARPACSVLSGHKRDWLERIHDLLFGTAMSIPCPKTLSKKQQSAPSSDRSWRSAIASLPGFLAAAVHRYLEIKPLCPPELREKEKSTIPTGVVGRISSFVDEVVGLHCTPFSASSTLHGRLFGKQVHHLAISGGTSRHGKAYSQSLLKFSPACSY